MSLNPVMLAVRFLLELTAVVSFGVMGWLAFDSPWRYVAVLVLPVAVAAAWGSFAVPGDPSRNGKAPVAVPGVVRLVLELLVLGGGAVALWVAGLPVAAAVSGVVTVVYQVLAYDRVRWLLAR